MKNYKLRKTGLLGLIFLFIFLSPHFLISARAGLANIQIYPYTQNVREEADGNCSAVIMWNTAAAIDSKVEYRLFGSSNPWQSVTNSTAVSWHEIKLSGLEKDKKYTYRVYDGAEVTPERSFRTPLDAKKSFRFALYSDHRTVEAADKIYSLGPHFVLIPGDLTSDGKLGEFMYFLQCAHNSYLKEAPVYPVFGNHDWYESCNWLGHCHYYPYNFLQAFSLPNNEFYYSFDYGNCHIIGLDNSREDGIPSYETVWLDQELATFRSNIKNINKWLIVYMHKPPYSVGHSGSDGETQAYWVPLFRDYKVDLVLSGHEHCYERIFKDGIYYIVTGLAGGRPQETPSPSWLEKYIQADNFGVIDINNVLKNNNLVGSYLNLTAYNVTSLAPIDTLSLYKNAIDLALSSPANNSFIRGQAEIRGSASALDGFQKYELYYAPESSPTNTTLITSLNTPVLNGVLGVWDTLKCAEGKYILTLKVVTTFREVKTSLAVTIDNVNQAPVVKPLSNTGAVIGRLLQFKLEAADPDDPQTPQGNLIYSARNLPPGAQFDPQTQIFSWQPTEADKGIYEGVTFTVQDNTNIITQTITLSTVCIEETQITTNLSYQSDPAIYADKIVWCDYRNDNNDIYMYNLSAGQETQITTNLSEQTYPAIYGDKIVWEDERNGNWDIYMYNLSTRQETQITTNLSGQLFPAIYGDKIVWQDYRDFNWNLYMYNLSSGQEIRITTNTAYEEYPDIYTDKIVWQDNRNGNPDIYMYNLSARQETQITTNLSGQSDPAIYADKIVWCDYRNGEPDIYMYNLSARQETQITTNLSGQSGPAIYGDKIVWQDNRNGSLNADIYIYDLSTATETQLTTETVPQAYPAIYQNKIVWQDYRNENGDIYMAKVFFAPQIVSVSPTGYVQPGQIITIAGKNFGYTQENSMVQFANGAVCPINSWSNTQITCKIPNEAQTGLLKVITRGGESNGITVTVNRPPTIVSLSPNSGTFRTYYAPYYLITTVYSDLNGYNDLKDMRLLINTVISAQNAFYALYNKAQNKLYLYNGTAWVGGFAPGSSNVIETSWGKLYCTSTTVTGSGNNLTIKWSVSLKSSFWGIKNVYLLAYDSYTNSGWQKKGTITVNAPPTVVSLSPSSGTFQANTPYTFSTAYSDLNGYTDLWRMYLVVSSSPTSTTILYAHYLQAENKLYLWDPARGHLGGYAPGSNNVIETSYGKLYCAQTTVTGSGNNLTINWRVSFKSTLAGTKNVYLRAYDNTRLDGSEWQQKGAITIPEGPPPYSIDFLGREEDNQGSFSKIMIANSNVILTDADFIYSTASGNWLPANTYTTALRLNVNGHRLTTDKDANSGVKAVYRVYGNQKVQVKSTTWAQDSGGKNLKLNRLDTFQRQSSNIILINGNPITINPLGEYQLQRLTWRPRSCGGTNYNDGESYVKVTNDESGYYFDLTLVVREYDEECDSAEVWIESYIEKL
jgi:beta propeller repeat protein